MASIGCCLKSIGSISLSVSVTCIYSPASRISVFYIEIRGRREGERRKKSLEERYVLSVLF
jgi:hypothetical protein